MSLKYKFNWKGSSPKNVPANIRKAFNKSKKNALPKGLLKATAKNFIPKSKLKSYANVTKKKARKN